MGFFGWYFGDSVALVGFGCARGFYVGAYFGYDWYFYSIISRFCLGLREFLVFSLFSERF